jgi:hypothetical protein
MTFVTPEARALPWFEKGMWMNDGSGTGTCIAVFDTEDHAMAAIVPLTPAGGPPVIGSEVQEFEVQAKFRAKCPRTMLLWVVKCEMLHR